jgi:hypothetical protein
VLLPQLPHIPADSGLEFELLDGLVGITVAGGAGLVAQQGDVGHWCPV